MVTAPSSTTDVWKELVKKTRHPILGQGPDVVSGDDRFLIRYPRVLKGCMSLVALVGLFIVVACILIVVVDPGVAPFAYMGSLCGLFFLGLGVWGIFPTAEVSWETGGDVLTIRIGWLWSVKSYELDRETLTAYLGLGEDTKNFRLKGDVILGLRRTDDENDEVRLVRAPCRSDLLPLFDQLSAFVSGSTDQTLVPVTLPDGRSLVVSKAAPDSEIIGGGYFSGKLTVFLNPNPDLWVLQASSPYIAFNVIWIVLGAGAIGMGAYALLAERWFGPFAIVGVFAILLGSAFILVGCFLMIRAVTHRVVFDRRRREIRVIRSRGPHWVIPFAEVAAVQLCSQFQGDSDGEDYTSYYLNLVRNEPPGERLPIVSTNRENDCREYARRLSEILDRPVLDHVTSFEE